MRNAILFASAALAVFINFNSARAADVQRPPFSWTGLYAGANGGYGEGVYYDQLQDLSNPGTPFSGLSPKGGFGGGQVGANWQIPGAPLVAGLETDFQGSGIRDSQNWTMATSTSELSAFGTLRGRAGIAFDRWLVYGTGGLAYGHVDNSVEGPKVYTISRDAIGWAAGAGVEWAFAANWSVKAEYQYLNLGLNVPVGSNGPLTSFPGVTVHEDAFSTVRLGINYKFW
jgi:outer membrane immunogenic protein